MDNYVSLAIVGRQRGEDGEEAVTKLYVTARYWQRCGSHYFLYEETLEESGAVIQNTLKLKDGVLELVKRGTVNSRMVFETGKTYLTDYDTPYGRLKIDLHTKALDAVLSEEFPTKINAVYSLSSAGQLFAECVLTIEAAWN